MRKTLVILVMGIIVFSGVIVLVQAQTCFGVASSSPTVCSGNGTCIATDTCLCNELATGSRCEIAKCFGLDPSDPLVCSGHGTCRATGTCLCFKGYAGFDCSVLRCYQLTANTITVCSGRGTCVAPNTCVCEEGYAGFSCQFKVNSLTCFGKTAGQGDVCSGHGKCVNVDTCSCEDGYSGNDCSTKNCGSFLPTDPGVCSKRGNCTDGVCNCWSGFGGEYCERGASSGISDLLPRIDFYCNGMNASDESLNGQICSGHGKCIGFDTCSCEMGYSGSNCEKYSCFGLDVSHEKVCGGVGDCISLNKCSCPQNYEGQECQQVKCLGLDMSFYNFTDYSRVCSGRGNCSENGCNCKYGYLGEACQTTKCFDLPQNNSQVCSGHGICSDFDTCQCYSSPEEGFWFGDDCSVCDPFHTGPDCKSNKECSDESTCNNLGKCSPDNSSCICSDQRYSGKYCEECSEFYFGFNCETYCDSNKTCNNHGECSRDGFCQCFESTSLGFWKNGTCNECMDGYYGKECRTFVKGWKFSFDKFGYFVKFTIVAPIEILNKIQSDISTECNTLFNSPNLGQLPLVCDFSIQSLEYFEGIIRVQLPPDSQLIPGDSLLFKILHFEDSSSNKMVTIYSTTAQVILPPMPAISANSTISYNSFVDLIGYNARNIDNLDEYLNFEWSLNSSSLSSTQALNSLSQNINNLSGQNKKSVRITNLPVGSHLIQLRLQNRFNTWSERYSIVNITRLSNDQDSSESIPVITAKILLESDPFYYTSDLVTTATQFYYIKKQITIDGEEVNHPEVRIEWGIVNSENIVPLASDFAFNSGVLTNFDLSITRSILAAVGAYTISLKVYNMTSNELLITKTHRLQFITSLPRVTVSLPQITTFSSTSPDFPYRVTLNFPQSSFGDSLEGITWECFDVYVPSGQCDSEWPSILASSINQTVLSIPVNVYMRRSRSVRITIKSQVGKVKIVTNQYVGSLYGLAYSGWSDSNSNSVGYSGGVGHWFSFGSATTYTLYMKKFTNNWVSASGPGTLTVFDYLNGNQQITSFSNYLQLDNTNGQHALRVTPANIPSSIKILKTVRSLTEDGVPMQLDMYFVKESFIEPTVTFENITTRNLPNGWIHVKIQFTVVSRYYQNIAIYFFLKIGPLSLQILNNFDIFTREAEFVLPQFTIPFEITYAVNYFQSDTITRNRYERKTGMVTQLEARPLSQVLTVRAFQLRMKYHVDNNFGGDISSIISSASNVFVPFSPSIQIAN